MPWRAQGFQRVAGGYRPRLVGILVSTFCPNVVPTLSQRPSQLARTKRLSGLSQPSQPIRGNCRTYSSHYCSTTHHIVGVGPRATSRKAVAPQPDQTNPSPENYYRPISLDSRQTERNGGVSQEQHCKEHVWGFAAERRGSSTISDLYTIEVVQVALLRRSTGVSIGVPFPDWGLREALLQ